MNRLKIAEKERDNLSGSKYEAENFIEKEKEIRRKKNLLYQIFEVQESSHLTNLKQKLDLNNEKLSEAKSKLKESERSFVTMEKTYESTKFDYNKIDEELQKFTSVCDDLILYINICVFGLLFLSLNIVLSLLTPNPILYTYSPTSTSYSQEFGAFERRDVKLQEDMSHLKSQIKKMQVNVTKEQKKEEECLRDAEKAKVEVLYDFLCILVYYCVYFIVRWLILKISVVW